MRKLIPFLAIMTFINQNLSAMELDITSASGGTLTALSDKHENGDYIFKGKDIHVQRDHIRYDGKYIQYKLDFKSMGSLQNPLEFSSTSELTTDIDSGDVVNTLIEHIEKAANISAFNPIQTASHSNTFLESIKGNKLAKETPMFSKAIQNMWEEKFSYAQKVDKYENSIMKFVQNNNFSVSFQAGV